MLKIELEVSLLAVEMMRLGEKQADGSVATTFGQLFDDDRCANLFEALVGTLKAAKKRGKVAYDAPLLLKGTHDNVVITLSPGAATEAASADLEDLEKQMHDV